MAKQKAKISYNNLIDLCINLETSKETADAAETFKRLLSSYFFKKEVEVSKKMENFFERFKSPEFLQKQPSLYEIDFDQLQNFIKSDVINETLTGKIMLSEQYLKSFYSQHPPSFTKLPEDIKDELIDRIKEKNDLIIKAFEKMLVDREADKKRKLITLIALILKNIHKKTGRPFNKLEQPVNIIINDIFEGTDQLFTASATQISELQDDTKIKELVKEIFVVKQFKEISEIAGLFKKEFERYKKRTIRAKT